jgi:hypothetical protein
MQGLYKESMGAVVTSEQQVYYFHSETNTESLTHNQWVEFSLDEDNKACIQCDGTQEEIQEELLLEEEE